MIAAVKITDDCDDGSAKRTVKSLPKIDVICKAENCGATFLGTKFAKYCPKCRPLFLKPRKCRWVITDDVRELLNAEYNSSFGCAKRIAAKLRWPVWAVKRAAGRLGLARPQKQFRRKWTPDEVQLLRSYEGFRTAEWIAAKLGRSVSSVAEKMRYEQLSRRISNGYTTSDLAACLGETPLSISQLVHQGKLKPMRPPSGTKRTPMLFSEQEIKAFLKTNCNLYRLNRVNQLWFCGLMFGVTLASVDSRRA